MQVENRNSYNATGRMGPVYPRPEYRPPQSFPETPQDGTAGEPGKGTEGKGKSQAQAQTESLILSPRLRRAQAPAASDPGVKLTAQTARALSDETADRIAGLNPRADNGCPHRKPEGHGLLYPVYA
jgi:hypothetical protein